MATRKQKAVKRFVGLVKKGSLAKSKFLDKPGGLSGLSTESLQAATGKAPLPSTNISISRELQKRVMSPDYDNAGTMPAKRKKRKVT